jgi:hypothetical protein
LSTTRTRLPRTSRLNSRRSPRGLAPSTSSCGETQMGKGFAFA